MMKKYWILGGLVFGLISCNAQTTINDSLTTKEVIDTMKLKVNKSEEEWRRELSPEQYYVLREKGTERPYSGKYNMHFENGVYHCAACEAPLFESESKFDSHCGWPSFDKPVSEDAIIEKKDSSHGMIRTEILCGKCGGHLGHVFDDGPTETGLRYCINSVSLGFDEEK